MIHRKDLEITAEVFPERDTAVLDADRRGGAPDDSGEAPGVTSTRPDRPQQ